MIHKCRRSLADPVGMGRGAFAPADTHANDNRPPSISMAIMANQAGRLVSESGFVYSRHVHGLFLEPRPRLLAERHS